jgi:hypothetical protein
MTDQDVNGIRNPIEESIQSFERIMGWALAVSVGTLLWFAGNFDKFTIKCNEGNTFIPYNNLFIIIIILLSASSSLLGIIQLNLYYVRFKFTSKVNLKMLDYINKSKAIDTTELNAGNIDQMVNESDNLKTVQDEVKDKMRELTLATGFIFSKGTNIMLAIAGLFYLIGVFISGIYYILFIHNYR